MNGWNNEIAMAVAAGEGLLILLMFIWLAALSGKLSKLKKAHRKLVGETGVSGIEDVMHSIHEQLSNVDRTHSQQEKQLQQIERRLTALKGRVGVHRFNAFSDTGSDLSFSIAFVNEEEDGVVITGIHGREQTFLYAKPIDKGQSAYMLTPEEKTAISLAAQKA
jgi:hypothetical protein